MVKRTTISMRPELWRAMEEMIKRGMFKNPSDFIQHLIRQAWEADQLSGGGSSAATALPPTGFMDGKARGRKVS